MKGDFSRNTFDPSKHFSRVLMQQGRVQLDADWNEQAAILLHYLQTLAKDLIGEHGGPGESFKIEQRLDADGHPIARDFSILPGHYYVHGILCENEGPSPLAYTNQPDYPLSEAEQLSNQTYLAYLDVWERHITHIEGDSIREVALNGPDTATRAKVVWQVKVTDKLIDEEGEEQDIPDNFNKAGVENAWKNWLEKWQSENRGQLKAKAKEPEGADLTDPCITPPEARYRGAENQLYRVEIHTGSEDENGNPATPTFKWSRDNGSVTFPIRKLQGNVATLEHLGWDSRLSLKADDWVEIADDDRMLRGQRGLLLQVDTIDAIDMTVTLRLRDGAVLPVYDENSTKHPLLRRWDHKEGDSDQGAPKMADDGALLVQEDEWLNLEDGVQIHFQGAHTGTGEEHRYRTGDYWLIPARTATRDVEWPQEENDQGELVPKAEPPHGVEHHYAPLWLISVADGEVTAAAGNDCRRLFKQLWE